MTHSLTIALDAMGGDNGPRTVVEGAEIALRSYPKLRFLLFGDEAQVTPLVKGCPGLAAASEIRHADLAILGTDKPSEALRRGQESSMGRAIQAVKSGEAAVAVSAGNTGALMALAKFILRTMPGIHRPALVSCIPTSKGDSVMLDLGANVEADEKSLVQFAIMGAAYAQAVMGLERPTVGLLNVGVEELKGHGSVKSAGKALKAMDLPLEFAGFIEGGDIGSGMVDVIVTDGFTGNVAIKTAEGTARFMLFLLEQVFRRNLIARLAYLLTRKRLNELREHFKPSTHNGGVFLGLNGLVVKSHGGADRDGFASALRVAAEMAADDICGTIRNNLATPAGKGEPVGQAAAS